MIYKINVDLDLPKEKRTTNLGSILHGVLMEMLPHTIVENLHTNSKYSPLKQRVLFRGEKIEWEIVLFDSEIAKFIQLYFINNDSILLKKHDLTVSISNYFVEKIDIKNLIDKHFNNDSSPRYVKLHVKTPMSFKSNGTYEIFPDVRKMFRSAMLAFDTFFDEYQMYDADTLNYIQENVQIIDYNLKSTRFHLEGVKIPSFVGQITIKVNGAKTFVRLVNFLTEFGSLAGVGIKTSIGMGKYEII
ncbi:CRISPR-associated endoribonuclease Cas6 [Macrococcus capreoli]